MKEIEALKGLKNLSQIFKLCSENDVKLKDFNIMNPKAYKEAIETILDLYNKEKEKNIELLNSKIGVDLSYDDYISKDKIKEKIKELQEESKLAIKEKDYVIEAELGIQIVILEELLEEK